MDEVSTENLGEMQSSADINLARAWKSMTVLRGEIGNVHIHHKLKVAATFSNAN